MIFHPLHTQLPKPHKMNNPFDYVPDALCLLAAEQTKALIKRNGQWYDELTLGKMFGVLVVERTCDDGIIELGFLSAYSGQILGRSDWADFVPAVFDYLQEGGYFKTHEAEITTINKQINAILNSQEHKNAKAELEQTIANADTAITDYKKMMAEAKARRDAVRATANEAELIRESQFQKAELRRIKHSWRERINACETQLKALDNELAQMKSRRHKLSDALQRWLFSQFVMLNDKGERRNLLDIFHDFNGQLPPAGTGECCAPKLLQYAYANNMKPVCMAEFWWQPPSQRGKEVVTDGEVRHHQTFYPSCRGKCLPTLTYMLSLSNQQPTAKPSEPLRIIYEDADIVVVDKPGGMLSVPGKGNEPSVETIIRRKCCNDYDGPIIVHRLDMDTCGIMVLAKNKTAHQRLQAQFLNRRVHKRYIALLEKPTDKRRGTIDLPLCPDIDDRPRQKVDFSIGKPSISDYIIIGEQQYKDWQCKGHTLVALYPHTGRTHQLRVHCASRQGLNNPIVGDRLYGSRNAATTLCLCADKIVFSHPISGHPLKYVANELV